MTIIEFYDKNAIENIAGAMMCRPENVALLGDDEAKILKSCDIYKKVLGSNGINVKFYYQIIDKNDLSCIVNALDRIVSRFDDCVFDLTGGDELYLVAVGIIMERYKGKIKCHRFNFAKNSIIDCDADGKIAEVESYNISVEDNITIYGGDLVTDTNEEKYTYDWAFDREFEDDVENMWSICSGKPSSWNFQINVIKRICQAYGSEDSLDISFDPDRVVEELGCGNERYEVRPWLLSNLERIGVIHSLYIGDYVSFSFKNEQIKKCLTTAGQILELYIAVKLRQLGDLYHDVRVGAVINWDGDGDDECNWVINEIDVFAMRGAIPIFISCKNGLVEMEELYKLNSVAMRFGGKYAKKVLVTSDIHNSNKGNAEYLLERMEEMGIISIDNIVDISDHDLKKTLSTLWKQ